MAVIEDPAVGAEGVSAVTSVVSEAGTRTPPAAEGDESGREHGELADSQRVGSQDWNGGHGRRTRDWRDEEYVNGSTRDWKRGNWKRNNCWN